MWGYLQKLVYREPMRDEDHLILAITRCWNEIIQELVHTAVDLHVWSRRVAAVIRAQGGHTEYLLD